MKAALPFRWILPIVQLVICAAVLWPVRGEFAREYLRFRQPHSVSLELPEVPLREGGAVQLIIGPLSEEERLEQERRDRLMTVPMVLNIPVLFLQLPYIVNTSDKREWIPFGIDFRIWRAVTWPILGSFFWYFGGRGLEALLAARRRSVEPRMTLPETLVGLIFSIGGLLLIFSFVWEFRAGVPADDFLTAVPGTVMIWASLGSFIVVAKLAQLRIMKSPIQARLPR
jgi:hypothetical protein